MRGKSHRGGVGLVEGQLCLEHCSFEKNPLKKGGGEPSLYRPKVDPLLTT